MTNSSDSQDRTSQFLLIAILAVIILGGAAILYYTVGQAGTALRALSTARNQAEASRLNALAKQAQAEAEREAAAEAAAESAANSEKPDTARLKASLDESARTLDTAATPMPPAAEAALRSSLGSSYLSINELRAAETQLARAVDLFAASTPADNEARLRAEAALRTVRERLAADTHSQQPAPESPR